MNITWALLMMALGGVGVPNNGHDADVAAALQSAMNPPSSQNTLRIQRQQRLHRVELAARQHLNPHQAQHQTQHFIPIRSRMHLRLRGFM